MKIVSHVLKSDLVIIIRKGATWRTKASFPITLLLCVPIRILNTKSSVITKLDILFPTTSSPHKLLPKIQLPSAYLSGPSSNTKMLSQSLNRSDHLGDLDVGKRVILKRILKYMRIHTVCTWLQHQPVDGSCCNKYSYSIKVRGFLDQLSDYQFYDDNSNSRV